MKKSKLAKLAMLGIASSFCLSAQDLAPEEKGEVVMHKKSEDDYKADCKGRKQLGNGQCGSKSSCSGKEAKRQSRGTCNHSSYNETDKEDDSYQTLRAKRHRSSEGR